MNIDAVFPVTPNTTKTQFGSQISALANGGFAAAWVSDEGPPGAAPTNIYLQRYDYLGALAGETVLANTTTGNNHIDASVTGLRGGGLVVAWTAENQDAEGRGTYGRVYDAAGQPVGDEIQLHTVEESFQATPRLAALANGGFVASWTSNGLDGDFVGIAAQMFSASGGQIGPEFVVNSFVESDQAFVDVAALESGGFVAVWHGRKQGTTDLLDIFGQRFSDDGTRLGPELKLETDQGSYTGFPAVSGLKDGGFVVVWRDNDTATREDRILAQDFDADGVARRAAFQVNTFEDGEQARPRVAGLEDGGFLVTWSGIGEVGSSPTGIWAQHYGPDATPIGGQVALDDFDFDETPAQASFAEPSVTGLSDGGYAVSFTQSIAGVTEGRDIAARFKQGTEAVSATGGPADDLMSGGRFDDVLSGAGGNDRLIGREGADQLSGGDGADTMIGGDGGDTFRVDNAGDRVGESRKWAGTDTVISSVDFRMGRQHIENLDLTGDARIGAGNGLQNVIRGNDSDNILDGGKNNDTLIGGLGDDTYLLRAPGDTIVEQAGAGNDTAKSYGSFALMAHVEKLFMQTVFSKDGTPVNFNGIGNGLDNTIIGTPFENTIVGREGSDTLKGQAGADTFVFDRAIGTDVDRIIDFNANEADEGDLLKLKGSEFGGLAAGTLPASAFAAGTMARDMDDRIIFDQASGQLWFDADGSGAGAQILFATFDQNAVVTAADIEVF